ncbi:hypothetical protein AMTRI_Chr11g156940 [Amborella trichopoda]
MGSKEFGVVILTLNLFFFASLAQLCPPNVVPRLPLCALDIVNGALDGAPSRNSCCSLLKGLRDLDSALCLCTFSNLLKGGLDALAPVARSCGKNIPNGFKCP